MASPRAEERTNAEFEIGDGRLSGALSIALGALSLLAVLCFRFPELLTTPELRAVYPLGLVRAALFGALLLALAFGALAVLLGNRRAGLAGLALGALAIALGGAWVEARAVAKSAHLGLDWFVLDLLVLALVFVPLERAFALARAQRILRAGWRTDLAHFFVSHLLVGALALLTIAPAALLLGRLVSPRFQAAVGALPLALQVVLAIVGADLVQYATHRAFHSQPALWRFHAIHHSAREMDWLAGSRLHLVDVIATRAAGFAPLFLLGISQRALAIYLVLVSFQAVFLHANVRFRFGPLRWVFATPEFHHWHHAEAPVDKNFAVHVPLIDRVFGTAWLPGGFPERYGIAGDPVPSGWWPQLRWPFARRR
ncbi:MAG TPA: sterol desaturase family protein [Myxococcota bacterium]|nr:sterol desaturase family protein [Myxococcota bacterium]